MLIGGNNYKIETVDHVVENGEEYLGICDYEKNLILVSKDLAPGRARSVITHELTHAIFYEAGYLDHDEEMITRIGIVLNQFLQDNFGDDII